MRAYIGEIFRWGKESFGGRGGEGGGRTNEKQRSTRNYSINMTRLLRIIVSNGVGSGDTGREKSVRGIWDRCAFFSPDVIFFFFFPVALAHSRSRHPE